MLLLVDECLPERLVLELKARGHDVVWARESYAGWDDVSILTAATREERIVVTEDRDFGTLAIRQRQPAVGIVIAHFEKFTGTLREIVEQIADALEELGPNCTGALSVIEPGRTRQRQLPDRTP